MGRVRVVVTVVAGTVSVIVVGGGAGSVVVHAVNVRAHAAEMAEMMGLRIGGLLVAGVVVDVEPHSLSKESDFPGPVVSHLHLDPGIQADVDPRDRWAIGPAL